MTLKARNEITSHLALVLVAGTIIASFALGLIAAHPLGLVNTILVPIIGALMLIAAVVVLVGTWESMKSILKGEACA